MKIPGAVGRGCFYLAFTLLACSRPARSGVIVSVGGSTIGYTGAAGISAGWSMSAAQTNVTISAHLGNGNSLPSTGIAYLTNSIGPGTTLANEISQANVLLACTFCDQDVVLFSGLDLPAGNYWITFGAPAPPISYLNWAASNPASVAAGPGSSYTGFAYLVDGYGPFPPGSSFIFPAQLSRFAYQFSVTSATSIPEPATLSLVGVALLALSRRSRKQRS
jgi:hypothetical protein